MLIQLPLETWIEILDWLRRRDLIKKLDKLWDREFTPIVQDWLHKYTRNVRIGWLLANTKILVIGKHKDIGLRVRVGNKLETVPFADVELLENITGFERIDIKYLDSTILAFLRRLRPLFHNIHLGIDDYELEQPTRTALSFLIPIISSIESIYVNYKFLHFFSTKYPSTLSNAKLLKTWEFQALEGNDQILTDWLFTKRADGHALILLFWFKRDDQIFGFCEKIRKRFLDPARQFACFPFFVRIWIDHGQRINITGIRESTDNVRTGEQLTFKTVELRGQRYRLITNCPINTDVEWLNKKTGEVLQLDWPNEEQVIRLHFMEINPQLYAENATNQQQASGSGKKHITHLRL